MKYLKQAGIIFAFSLAGEGLSRWIPVPVPASIYGIVLLFLTLETGLLKPESIRETGRFLITIMPVMFIPAAAGLLEDWPVLRTNWLAYLVIMGVTTVVVMAVSGWVTQWVIRRRNGGDGENE